MKNFHLKNNHLEIFPNHSVTMYLELLNEGIVIIGMTLFNVVSQVFEGDGSGDWDLGVKGHSCLALSYCSRGVVTGFGTK